MLADDGVAGHHKVVDGQDGAEVHPRPGYRGQPQAVNLDEVALADLEPVPGDSAPSRERRSALPGEVQEPPRFPEMGPAFLAPGHRFDDAGRRPAAVGHELCPGRQRKAMDFRCRDQGSGDNLVMFH